MDTEGKRDTLRVYEKSDIVKKVSKQRIMTERTLHFASKGFRTQLVEIAPEPTEPKSKRYGLIEEEDVSLNRKLGELEESTKARNRAFQQRIDEIWALTDVWEAKLRTEAREAVETITNQRVEYQKYLDDFNAQLQLEIKVAYDRIDDELIPTQVARHKKVGEELAYFVEKVAPVEIDKTSGEVKRQLKKLYEMFQMGQQKEFIREQKFVKSVNRHIQSTAQRFTDEKSLQIACFFNLEDDVVEHERRAARMHLYRWTRCVDNVVNLKEEIDVESHVRNTEDAILLDTIVDTQQLLQVGTTLLLTHSISTRCSHCYKSSDHPESSHTRGYFHPLPSFLGHLTGYTHISSSPTSPRTN